MDEAVDEFDPIELDLPDGIREADRAVELIRAWVGDGRLLVTLNSDAFGPRIENWGRLLAEIGHHVARSAALQGDMSEQDALAAVAEGFDSRILDQGQIRSGRQLGRSTN